MSNKVASIDRYYMMFSVTLNIRLDELLLFNRALSASEIKSLYDARANPYSNVLSLSAGSHTIKAYAVDTNGKMYATPEKKIVVV